MKKEGPEICVRCGKCLPQCPSYRFFLQEGFSPRGRNFLLDREISSQSFDFCLFCDRCAQTCPYGLSFPQVYLRRAFEKKGVEYPYLENPLSLLSLHPRGREILKDFEESVIKNFPSGDFYLFLSCGLKHLYPSALFIFLEKVRTLGVKPHLPEAQDCCGIPYVSLRSAKTLKRYALRKLELFSEKKPLVTFCATCYWVIKRVYPLLFEGSPEAESVYELAGRTLFVTEFLTESLGLSLEFEEDPRLLYHLPCHLKSPLTSVEKGVKNKLKIEDFCCGSAKPTLWLRGFQKDFFRLWKGKLLGKGILATACTGCYLNFTFLIRRPPEVKHWMELWR
jgi:glycolate oxidase iron-sulfur subunit